MVHRGLMLAFLVLACSHEPACTHQPVPPNPKSDCEAACATLGRLGCEEGEPTDAGATCAQVCHDVLGAQYDLRCVARLTSCDVESCAR